MEKPRVIIDTDILIDLLRNKKEALTFITQLETQEAELSTTAINSFELYYGAHRSSQPKKNLQATRKLLGRMNLLPLTPRSAQKAGHLYANLESQGQPIGLRDTLIAAIALTRERSLATRNAAHFGKIESLKTLTY